MKIDNPHERKQFERIDKNAEGEEMYGYRTVDGLEEIVHLPTGRSNMTYYKPQAVVSPEGCKHSFQETDKGKREYTCSKCQWGLTAHITQLNEKNGKLLLNVRGVEYEIS